MRKRTIALDFDGVLHSYNGWNGGMLCGPIPGALDAVTAMQRKGQEVVVFTTRDATEVAEWLTRHGFPALEVTNIKRPFYVMVDDRVVHFEGKWGPEMTDRILSFEPYRIKARTQQIA